MANAGAYNPDQWRGFAQGASDRETAYKSWQGRIQQSQAENIAKWARVGAEANLKPGIITSMGLGNVDPYTEIGQQYLDRAISAQAMDDSYSPAEPEPRPQEKHRKGLMGFWDDTLDAGKAVVRGVTTAVAAPFEELTGRLAWLYAETVGIQDYDENGNPIGKEHGARTGFWNAQSAGLSAFGDLLGGDEVSLGQGFFVDSRSENAKKALAARQGAGSIYYDDDGDGKVEAHALTFGRTVAAFLDNAVENTLSRPTTKGRLEAADRAGKPWLARWVMHGSMGALDLGAAVYADPMNAVGKVAKGARLLNMSQDASRGARIVDEFAKGSDLYSHAAKATSRLLTGKKLFEYSDALEAAHVDKVLGQTGRTLNAIELADSLDNADRLTQVLEGLTVADAPQAAAAGYKTVGVGRRLNGADKAALDALHSIVREYDPNITSHLETMISSGKLNNDDVAYVRLWMDDARKGLDDYLDVNPEMKELVSDPQVRQTFSDDNEMFKSMFGRSHDSGAGANRYRTTGFATGDANLYSKKMLIAYDTLAQATDPATIWKLSGGGIDPSVASAIAKTDDPAEVARIIAEAKGNLSADKLAAFRPFGKGVTNTAWDYTRELNKDHILSKKEKLLDFLGDAATHPIKAVGKAKTVIGEGLTDVISPRALNVADPNAAIKGFDAHLRQIGLTHEQAHPLVNDMIEALADPNLMTREQAVMNVTNKLVYGRNGVMRVAIESSNRYLDTLAELGDTLVKNGTVTEMPTDGSDVFSALSAKAASLVTQVMERDTAEKLATLAGKFDLRDSKAITEYADRIAEYTARKAVKGTPEAKLLNDFIAPFVTDSGVESWTRFQDLETSVDKALQTYTDAQNTANHYLQSSRTYTGGVDPSLTDDIDKLGNKWLATADLSRRAVQLPDPVQLKRAMYDIVGEGGRLDRFARTGWRGLDAAFTPVANVWRAAVMLRPALFVRQAVLENGVRMHMGGYDSPFSAPISFLGIASSPATSEAGVVKRVLNYLQIDGKYGNDALGIDFDSVDEIERALLEDPMEEAFKVKQFLDEDPTRAGNLDPRNIRMEAAGMRTFRPGEAGFVPTATSNIIKLAADPVIGAIDRGYMTSDDIAKLRFYYPKLYKGKEWEALIADVKSNPGKYHGRERLLQEFDQGVFAEHRRALSTGVPALRDAPLAEGELRNLDGLEYVTNKQFEYRGNPKAYEAYFRNAQNEIAYATEGKPALRTAVQNGVVTSAVGASEQGYALMTETLRRLTNGTDDQLTSIFNALKTGAPDQATEALRRLRTDLTVLQPIFSYDAYWDDYTKWLSTVDPDTSRIGQIVSGRVSDSDSAIAAAISELQKDPKRATTLEVLERQLTTKRPEGVSMVEQIENLYNRRTKFIQQDMLDMFPELNHPDHFAAFLHEAVPQANLRQLLTSKTGTEFTKQRLGKNMQALLDYYDQTTEGGWTKIKNYTPDEATQTLLAEIESVHNRTKYTRAGGDVVDLTTGAGRAKAQRDMLKFIQGLDENKLNDFMASSSQIVNNHKDMFRDYFKFTDDEALNRIVPLTTDKGKEQLRKQVRRHASDGEFTNPVSGMDYKASDSGKGNFGEKAVAYMYDHLLDSPTKKFAELPVMKEEYWRRYIPEAKRIDPKYAGEVMTQARKARLSADQLEQLQKNLDFQYSGASLQPGDLDDVVRRAAVNRYKELFYTSQNRSRIGHALKNISPFYDAWSNATRVYIKEGINNPDKLYSALRTTQMAKRSIMHRDPTTGQEMITIPGSKQLTSMLTGGAAPLGLNVAANSMNVATAAALPGTGPAAQFLAAPIAKYIPNGEGIANILSPYGVKSPSDTLASPISNLIPSWGKGVYNAMFAKTPENNRDFMAVYSNVVTAMRSSGKYDTSTSAGQNQLVEKAALATRELIAIRGISKGMLGGSQSFDQLVKDGTTNRWTSSVLLAKEYYAMQDRAKADLEKSGREVDESMIRELADQDFIKRHGPDALIAVIPKTRTRNGMKSSSEFGAWAKSNDYLRDNYGDVWGYFGPKGSEFDLETYGEQMSGNDREYVPVDERVALSENAIARNIYSVQQRKLGDNAKTEQGRTYLRQLKEALYNEYPGYGQTFTPGGQGLAEEKVNQLTRAAQDPKVTATPAGAALSTYMIERDALVRSVGKSLFTSTAPQYVALREKLAGFGEELTMQYPEFSRLWDELLSDEVD